MTEERKVLAAIVLAAQAKYRAAWEKHRRDQSVITRAEMEQAQRELDDVQRKVVQESVAVTAGR